MDRNDWKFLTAFFAPLFTIAALYFLWRHANSSVAASWVQAIGVFAAVFLAGYLADRQAAKAIRLNEAMATKQRVANARTLVILLLPDISHVRDLAVLKQSKLQIWPSALNFPDNLKIDVPKILEDAVFGMKVDSEEFESIAKVVVAARRYNHFLDTVAALNLNEHGVSTFRADMQDKRLAVVKACDSALGIFG